MEVGKRTDSYHCLPRRIRSAESEHFREPVASSPRHIQLQARSNTSGHLGEWTTAGASALSAAARADTRQCFVRSAWTASLYQYCVPSASYSPNRRPRRNQSSSENGVAGPMDRRLPLEAFFVDLTVIWSGLARRCSLETWGRGHPSRRHSPTQ